jgi:patatin-like phospholipase/acyl hydrolase
VSGRPVRILSIDGGGIRGIIPATVLARIEERTGRPIADLFDLIAGTSTGGILALGLACPSEDGTRPRSSAAELVELYEQEGPDIFPPHPLAGLRRLFGPKYRPRGLERALRDRLGTARLADARPDVLVTAYDIGRRDTVFFRSERAKELVRKREPEAADYNLEMVDIALGTSAAPTYFPPRRIPLRAPQPAMVLVDGGVFANNPGMCAYVDVSAGAAPPETVLMVSLGTGSLTRPLSYRRARGWGLIGWAPPLFDVVLDGVSDATNYQLGRVLGDRYHRFQTELCHGQDDLDDASEDNIESLKLEADELLRREGERLDRVCKALAAPAGG